MSAPDLAALVGSRLCHDLVSPLGAIGNGVELLRMLHQGSDELELIEQAVTAAQAKVLLFRLAFGVAQPGQEVRGPDVAEALGALALHGRISLETALPSALPRIAARRLALAALCAESALAWGGNLHVLPGSVTARAERMRLDPALWDPMAAGTAVADPVAATVHFALLALEGDVSVHRDADAVTIRV
ncbi:MAG: histidine phosphotransferase [Rhodobacteraceae bacterium]|nr:histidine phosphotransferase [Paracoccaceae bacterium]